MSKLGKESSTDRLKIEQEIARRDGLYAPDAGLPDYKAIAETLGFTPDQLQREIFPNQKGKVKPRLTGIYTYPENDSVGANGAHIEKGADVEI